MSTVRARLTRRAALALALWWAAVVGCGFAAAWLLAGPGGWRQGSYGPLALDVALASAAVITAALAWWGARRWFDEGRIGAALEEAAGLRPGEVRGALELARGLPVGVSHTLATLAAEAAARRLDRTVGELSGSLGERVTRWIRRGRGVAVATMVALILLGVSSPSRAGRAWSGLARPLRLAEPPPRAAVSVTPGDARVPRGGDVDVRVGAPGLDRVELSWQAAGDIERVDTLALRGGVAVHHYTNIAAAIEYRVRTPDGRTTRRYRITPVDPLFVGDLRVEVVYPPHTRLPPDEFHGAVPPLRLPVGTRLDISGHASRPLSEAALTDSVGKPVRALDVKGPDFTTSWTPRRAGRFLWSLRDSGGGRAVLAPDPLDVELVADSAPVVAIPLPGVDTVMPLGRRQPLIVEARDDYGLSRLEVVAWKVGPGGEAQAPVTMAIDLSGTRDAMARPLLDMTGWGLLPGDHVRYFARATDNAPAPHVSRSRQYTLTVPDASEIRRSGQQRLDSMVAAVQQMAAEAGRKAQANRDRELQSAASGARSGPAGRGVGTTAADSAGARGSYQEHEEVEKALAEQKMLEAGVDSMRAELGDLQRSMEDAGQADPQLRAQLGALRKLMDQVAQGGLQGQLEELSKSGDAAKAADSENAKQTLAELAAQQQKLKENLDRALDRFRRAAAAQDFRSTTADAHELASQEHALADAVKAPGDSVSAAERARQQEDLARRTGELAAHMDTLRGRLDKLDERAASGAVQEAHVGTDEARVQMMSAMTGAASSRRRESGEAAERAASALDRAARQLDAAQQRMSTALADSMRAALSRTADDALTLARRQTALRREMEGSPQERIDSLRRDEEALLEGTRNLELAYLRGTRGAFDPTRDLSGQISKVQKSLQATIDVMGRQRSPTPAPMRDADQVVTDMNALALMAMAGPDASGSQQQGARGEGSRSTREQMQQLAQKQGNLAARTGQLSPLHLGPQALAEQLRKLAEEQRRLAEEISKAASEPRPGSTLGDLKTMADEARELARQMAQGRLTPDMMNRQGKLFHRLLDAGRGLQRDDEFSDERESKPGGDVQPLVVKPLNADELGELRYAAPAAAELQRLDPAVRRLVIEYFQRLNGRVEGAEGADTAIGKATGGGR